MKNLIYILVMILLVGSVFATTTNNNKIADLNARYAHFMCGVTLQQTQATALGKYVQAPSADKLTSDLAQIKHVADAGDPDAFNLATKTLQDDVKNISTDMKNARHSFRALNASLNTSVNTSRIDRRKDFADVATNWKVNIATFKTCILKAQENVASVRANQIQADIDRWNTIIADMNSKGFNTTQLQAIVTDAGKLTAALNAASQATDETTFQQKINDVRDLYLHVWARFTITRINLYLEKITPEANAAGMSDKVTEITTLLDKASTMATPDHKYGEGEFKDTWQDIKDAGTKLIELGKALKNAKTPATLPGESK